MMGKIYALKQLQLDSTNLYESGYFGKGSKQLLQDSMQHQLDLLRPQIVQLVELDTISEVDQTYLSCLGNEYGDIYETQLEWAMNNRFNKSPRPEFFEELVLPFRKKTDASPMTPKAKL